jgi:hypothetical protein
MMNEILILIFLFFLSQNQSIKKSDDISNQEYIIYSVILDSLYRYPSTKTIVICDSTNFDYFFRGSDIYTNGIDSLYLKIIINGFGLSDSNYIYHDYLAKNKNKYKLFDDMFSLDINLSFISKRQFEDIFEGDLAGGWQEFYDKFPNSTGFVELTRIGFNERKDKVIVYVENYCGGLCGDGNYLLLEKINSKWKITKRKEIWVS